MRDILTAAAARRGQHVLGTVVDVRGSSYRKPGARVLIGQDGSRVGLISGGCLEKDVVRKAFAWTEGGPEVVLFDTRGDRLEPKGDYGTGCDGMVWLLLENWPVDGIDPLAEIRSVWETHDEVVLSTLYDGSEALGARGVLRDSNAQWSPDFPKRLRTHLLPHMEAAREWSRPRSVRLQFGEENVSVLVEPLRPPPELLVFGAGDDVQPLVRIASAMGWEIRVADRWPALVTRDRFPEATELVCQPVEKILEHVAPRTDSNVVLMTHSLTDDAALLPELLKSEASYVGLLGPRRRTARLMQILAEEGRLPSPDTLDRLQTPVGLDLGGEGPEEVALSIMSAITARRNERQGGVLQTGDQPIHPAHETIVEEIE